VFRILGSVCFWASRIRIRNLFVRIRILPSTSKKWKKKDFNFYCFERLLYDFLSLKNDVAVPSKSTKHKNLEKKIFFVGSKVTTKSAGFKAGYSLRYGSEDSHPDRYQKITDPEHW
jgi:hypothetical protein